MIFIKPRLNEKLLKYDAEQEEVIELANSYNLEANFINKTLEIKSRNGLDTWYCKVKNDKILLLHQNSSNCKNKKVAHRQHYQNTHLDYNHIFFSICNHDGYKIKQLDAFRDGKMAQLFKSIENDNYLKTVNK